MLWDLKHWNHSNCDIGITATWEAFENLKEILPGSVPKVLPPVVPGAPKPPPPRLQAGEDGWDTELDAQWGLKATGCKNCWIFLSRKGALIDLNAITVNSCSIHCDRYAGQPDLLLRVLPFLPTRNYCTVLPRAALQEGVSEQNFLRVLRQLKAPPASDWKWQWSSQTRSLWRWKNPHEETKGYEHQRTSQVWICAVLSQIPCRCWIRQQRAPSLKVLLWCLEARAGVAQVFWLWNSWTQPDTVISGW